MAREKRVGLNKRQRGTQEPMQQAGAARGTQEPMQNRVRAMDAGRGMRGTTPLSMDAGFGMQPPQSVQEPIPAAQVLAGTERNSAHRMTQERIQRAMDTLLKYKAGKTHLDSRLVEVEQWWKLRHWEWMQEQGAKGDMQTASAWLFNVIISKHADGIQSIPEANVLPREEGDRETARSLSAIIPCVLEQNEFDSVYSDVLWQKLKGGTGAYGVFWDKDKLNGLGDIAIKRVNLLHLFWEPGIEDIVF